MQITRKPFTPGNDDREVPPAQIVETHTPDLVSRVKEPDTPPPDNELDDDLPPDEGGEETDPQIEAEAKTMGWNPDGPLSAAEFVERGRTVLPIVNERNKALERKLADAEQKLSALAADAAQFREFAVREAKREVEEELTRLRAEHARAVSEGDGEAATRAAEAIADAKTRAATVETPPAQPQQPQQPPYDPLLEAWKARNTWYGTDPALTRRANAIAIVYRAEGKKDQALYDAVEQEMRDLRLIGERTRQPGDYADTGSTRGRGKGKTYADLPLEAKRTCDRFIARGWIKDRAQYVRDYFNETQQ